jgi:hypothetical protein
MIRLSEKLTFCSDVLSSPRCRCKTVKAPCRASVSGFRGGACIQGPWYIRWEPQGTPEQRESCNPPLDCDVLGLEVASCQMRVLVRVWEAGCERRLGDSTVVKPVPIPPIFVLKGNAYFWTVYSTFVPPHFFTL